LDFPTFSNISPTSQTSNDSPTSNETSLPGTSQMLNNVDGASPEKTKKRKRRTQAEILQDFKKKLAEANKNNKTMTKELLEEKKMEKLEKKCQTVRKKDKENNNIN
jgi:predicted transcriptional regulator